MIELTFKGNSLAEVFESMKAALGSEPVAEDVQKADAPEPTATITLAEIQKLTKAKLEEKKSAAIKELLAEFGVSKVGQVAEDDYANFYARLEEI